MKKLDKIFEPKIALPLITLIAVVFRVIPLRYKYLFGYDPYFHLAYIEESLKAGEWINFLTIAGGPWGFLIKNFHPLGLWMVPADVYKILKIFGVSLYDAFRITPVIFGVLTIVFFYLAMLNFYGKREAFFSALFLSIMFGHVFRSMANYYRGDNYMLFWYSVALFGVSLAIKYANIEGWRYKRFAFYLIPTFASGLAAIFWQAYYPIFVFLLGNAVLLAFGAFILGKDKYLLDSAVLTLSTAFGALLANYLGGYFGYGMLGGNRWLAKKTAENLGIELGAIKDVYLAVHLKYLVPLALAGIFALFSLSRIVKEKKQRALIVIILSIIGVFVLFMRFEALKELSSGFGILREAPILETQHSTFSDLWAAYNILVFLCPLFVLRFIPKRVKLSDFVLLGVIAPSLYMLYTWTRFLFIGSLAIAAMAGLGLISLHDNLYPILKSKLDDRKVLALSLSLLVVVPIISAGLGFERVYAEKPLINDHWVQALTWLKDNSNENDVVLAWWDYGHWVTYYARRSPIAQGGPSKWVALYYLGKVNANQLMARGVDYVIVSYDTAIKFGAILDTANVLKEGHFLMILPLVSKVGALIFQQGQYTITARPGKEWSILINTGTAVFSPKEAFLEYRGSITKLNTTAKNTADAYVYLNLNYGYAVLMSEKTFNTTLAKLMFTNEYSGDYQLVYSDGGYIKVFKFKHPNVAVEQTENEIIFKFENAIGTGLGVFGYLENGTKVFEKWYPVKGKTEFILPKDQVNGTVIRYAYAEGKKIVDRGVFRKE
ncbi:STT3 domain-containing protein [Thermococcus sp. LS2]|uniref:STT3 domain-containing protein n=1 Tax=Thermococcus sp. LS2 TaxID=1638260 RepID=UPI00143BC73E|nr:STT3 domain-containing protein [Thermococcus sp. LS2]NJE12827.1 oligosaccharyl transferase, STT3 subunit [Thermococcus sp. LS2]